MTDATKKIFESETKKIVRFFNSLNTTKFHDVVYNNFSVSTITDPKMYGYTKMLVDQPTEPIEDVEPAVYAYYSVIQMEESKFYIRFMIDRYADQDMIYENFIGPDQEAVDFLKKIVKKYTREIKKLDSVSKTI